MKAIKQYLSEHPVFEDHLKSGLTTFVTVFIVSLLTSVQGGFGPSISSDLFISLLVAATRAGMKALVEQVIGWLPARQ